MRRYQEFVRQGALAGLEYKCLQQALTNERHQVICTDEAQTINFRCKNNWHVECLLIELRKNVHFRNSPIRPLHLLFRKPPSHYILQLNGDAVFHFSKSRVHN